MMALFRHFLDVSRAFALLCSAQAFGLDASLCFVRFILHGLVTLCLTLQNFSVLAGNCS